MNGNREDKDMKKYFKFFMLAAAAVAALSCAKEIAPEINETPVPEVEVELVPMTFTATSDVESKVAYEDGATVWKVGDVIKVIAATGTATDFTATTVEGNIATFEGLTEKAETYYAVSPATAYVGNDIDNDKIYANIPETQTAVASSFDPKAFLSVATNSGDQLSFKNACAVIGFQLEEPTDVKSVRFTATGQTNLAGTGVVKTDNIPSHSWDGEYADRSALDMITLNAPTEGFKAETYYYFTVRPFSQTEDKAGFTFYVEKENNMKARKSTIAFDAVRNSVKTLGGVINDATKLSDLTPYESYQMGYDLVVAGKTYNKSSLGTATLVSTADYTIADNGVYFIDASAENLTINKASGSFTKLYVFGNSVSTKVPVKFAKELRYGTNGNVALKDLNIQQYSTNMFVHNNNEGTATLVALDGCQLTQPTSNGIIYNDDTRVVGTFAMHNCDVLVTADDFNVINARENFTNVEFVNNIFYSETDRKNFKLFNVQNNYTSEVVNITFVNNSLINVYLNPNGMIAPTALTSSFVNKQNLFENPHYLTVVNNTYRTMLRCGTDTYPEAAGFVWEAGWFNAGTTETNYGIKSSYKVVNDVVSPKDESGFKSLSFNPLTFEKAYSAGATR